MIYKNDEEVQEVCEQWKSRLRLQDWITKTKIYRGRDMKLENCEGECEWRLQTKIATIRILDPLDYPENLIMEQDMEKTLVHELLHLHFAPLYADTDDQSIKDAQEQAIDCIAYSLVNLHREKLSQAGGDNNALEKRKK